MSDEILEEEEVSGEDTPLLSDDLPDEVAEWDIIRDEDLEETAILDREKNDQWNAMFEQDNIEKYGQDAHVSSGMTFDEFAKEWVATGIDRAPTQEEYENWILWGDPGKLYAELRPGSQSQSKMNVGNVLRELGVDEESAAQYDKIDAAYYSKNDLAFLGEGEADFIQDGEFAMLPSDAKVGGRYHAVTQSEDLGYTLYYKQERADWYEDPVTAALIGLAASLVTAGVGSTAFAALVPSAVGTTVSASSVAGTLMSIPALAVEGAVVSAVGAGTTAELLGGDFWDAAGEAAITGAVTGGLVKPYLKSVSLTPLDQALVVGGAKSVVELATGTDFDEALEEGLLSGASSYAGSSYGALAEVAVKGVGTKIAGGSDDEVASAVASSLGKSVYDEFSGGRSLIKKQGE